MNAPATEQNKVLEAALEYQRQGYRLVPTFSPLMFKGEYKHVPRLLMWMITASKTCVREYLRFFPLTSAARISAYFRRYPDANIAGYVGSYRQLVVIDVDFYNEGEKTAAHYHLPETLRASTGNGVHYYYRLPPGVKLPTLKDELGTGMTIMGEGTFVLMPPSLHGLGNRYAWINPDTPIAMIPQNVLEKALSYPLPGLGRQLYSVYFFYLRKRRLVINILRVALWIDSHFPGLLIKIPYFARLPRNIKNQAMLPGQ